MSSLQLLWFALSSVLFAGFFFLEGFDFGVGMATKFLARNHEEREQVIKTIGPVWDGNEVWLITAGGAMFAAFPFWYASLFSGYYLVLLAILVGLIIRGVSFEFHHRMPMDKKPIWINTLFTGSLIIPFFFGVMFISLIQGMPMDAQGHIRTSFTDYINLFSIVGGVAMTLLSYLHGLNYLALKTTGAIHTRAVEQAKKLYPVLYVGLVAFAGLLYLKTDFFSTKLVPTLLLVVLIVALSALAHFSVLNHREWPAFLSSGLTFVAIVALLFVGLFPRVMISSLGSEFDLLIQNATSAPYTLKMMNWVTVTILPFVLAYTIWTYYIFRHRIKPSKQQTEETR